MTVGYDGVPVLVLGGSGFIGRWVTHRLTTLGATVTCAVRDPRAMESICLTHGIAPEVVMVDLLDDAAVHDLFASRRPAITFNLAGYGIDRAEQEEGLSWRINATLVAQLADLAERFSSDVWDGMRLVHVGSALEYGRIGGTLPEDAIPDPTTLYGITKLAGTRSLAERTSLAAVTVRLFTVYGPGEHAGRLLPTLLAAARHGGEVPLSAGDQRRDFTYVEDVADGLLRVGRERTVPGRVVNLATGTLTSVREFVEIAAQVLAIASDRLRFGVLPQRSDEMPHDAVSTMRLEQLIGWHPATGIAEGVRLTADRQSGRYLRGSGPVAQSFDVRP
ncbi:MAG: NAD-dependent epimerase/dehydratase [Gemmatimonas sp.]